MKFKKIISVALVMTMALSLFACQDTKKNKKSDKDNEEIEETEETKKSKKTKETEETKETEPNDEPVFHTLPEAPSTEAAYPLAGCQIEFKPEDQRYHYDMELTLDEKAHTIGGHVTFTFYNDSADDWDKLCFRDYSSLFETGDDIRSNPGEMMAAQESHNDGFEYDGAKTEITNIKDSRSDGELSYVRDEDDVSVVWMDLDKTLASGEEMTLDYDFVSKIPTFPDRYGYYENVFNVTNFYPILAEYENGDWSREPFYDVGECFYSEISDYDVTIDVPADYVVLTTGNEVSTSEDGGRMTGTYHADCVRDFVFSASDVFEVTTRRKNGVNITVAYNTLTCQANDPTGAIDAAFESAMNSLAIFNEAFGTYPYDNLDIIFTPLAAGGMEYPNLIIINDNYCIEKYCAFSRYDILINCVAHEIGHQWFMGIVGSSSGAQPWLDESFASYTELVFAEGYDYFLGETDLNASSAEANDLSTYKKDAPESFPVNMKYSDYFNDDAYCMAVYEYGKIFLYQLEEEVGQEAMQEFIRDYVQKCAFTNTNSDYFLELFYAHFGTDNERLNELVEIAFGS